MTNIGEPIENPGIELLPVEEPARREAPELVPVGPPEKRPGKREEDD